MQIKNLRTKADIKLMYIALMSPSTKPVTGHHCHHSIVVISFSVVIKLCSSCSYHFILVDFGTKWNKPHDADVTNVLFL